MVEPLRLKDLRLRLQAYGARPRKALGQNFLIDANLLNAIVEDAGVDGGDCVLEIGTGAGSLTACLCERAGLVVSIDTDESLFRMAGDALADAANLILLRGDALDDRRKALNPALENMLQTLLSERRIVPAGFQDARAPETIPELSSAGLNVVSNLPYSIATPLILALLESPLPVRQMYVMVQYEVALKLSARVGGEHWGIPALLLSQFAEASVGRRVPTGVFWPRPKVESAMLRLIPHRARPDMEGYGRLRGLAHLLFQHRRKSSANALSLALGENHRATAAWIEAAGGAPSARSEELSVEVLQRLADDAMIAPLVQVALARDEESEKERKEKRARRESWKRRVYGEPDPDNG